MTTRPRPKIRKGPLLALAAVFFAHAAVAQDSLGDFQLKPGPTETPAAQGPVAEGVPAPRVQPTATPTPTQTPSPLPTINPSAIAVPTTVPTPAVTITPPPAPAASPVAGPTAQPSPTPTANATAPPTQEPQPTIAASPTPVASATAAPAPLASASPALATAQAAEEPGSGFGWWPWLVALVLLGGGAAAGYAFWRRRAEAPVTVPPIERPRIPRKEAASEMPRPAFAPLPPEAEAKPGPERAMPKVDGEGLTFAIEARRLSFTLTSATLAYRVTLTNNNKTRLTGITVAGDMISAHSSLSSDQQLASANSELKPVHEIPVIAAGQTTQVTGEFRVPLTLIKPICKGRAVMFVPLVRLRVNAANSGAGVAYLTALVGLRSRQPGAGLQPFRLDYGPRIYSDVTQRIFSSAPLDAPMEHV